jgi:pyridoxal phosphate phosphatase PHOSPHO2
MKTKLAIFDFDSTVKKTTMEGNGLIVLLPDQKFTQEMDQCKLNHDWDGLRISIANELNSLNQWSKQDIVDAISKEGQLIQHIEKTIKFLSKDHDIIIISGALDEFVKIFLDARGILEHVTDVLSTPATITDEGKIVIKSYPENWIGPCTVTGRKLCKENALKDFIARKNDQYNEMVYVGDGSNDFCAARTLGIKDIICPRQGYALEKMLKKEEECISAQIAPWQDGLDLVEKLLLARQQK